MEYNIYNNNTSSQNNCHFDKYSKWEMQLGIYKKNQVQCSREIKHSFHFQWNLITLQISIMHTAPSDMCYCKCVFDFAESFLPNHT